MRFGSLIYASVLLISYIACSSNNPKNDLKNHVDNRIKKYPYASIVEIKKYVGEEEFAGVRELKFAITYEVTEDCFADQQSMYGITLADCSKKQPGGLAMYSGQLVKKGSKIYEDATLSYNVKTKKLSEIRFSATNQYKSPELEK